MIALGRVHRSRSVTIWASETTVAIELDEAKPGSCAAECASLIWPHLESL